MAIVGGTLGSASTATYYDATAITTYYYHHYSFLLLLLVATIRSLYRRTEIVLKAYP